jgi:hypothetical protein
MTRVVCEKCGNHHDCPRTMSLSERGRFVALKRWNAIKNGTGKPELDVRTVTVSASGAKKPESVLIVSESGFNPALLKRP